MCYFKIIMSGVFFLRSALARLGGTKIRRYLGRWTFDEPCIACPTFYENPADGVSSYDDNLKQYSRIEGRMYEDENLTLPTSVKSDMICDLIARGHTICDYFMVDDDVGVFSLFSGIAKLDFPVNKSEPPIGTGRYVYQGGSDLHAGILGRVTTVYEKELIKHNFCIQGSTYDHVVPPLN